MAIAKHMTEPVDCRIQGACVLSIIRSTDYGVTCFGILGWVHACYSIPLPNGARSSAIAGSELSLGLHLILCF